MNKTGDKKERKASEKKDKDKKAPKTEKSENGLMIFVKDMK